MQKRYWIPLATGTLVLVALPFVVYPIFLVKVACFALFAVAFNLALGAGGLLSFGHAAFFGGAAYAAGIVARDLGASFEVTVLASAGFASLLGFTFGWIAIRRKGIYFAMITLALAQLFYFAVLQIRYFGGEDGLQGIPRPRLLCLIELENDTRLYFVVISVACLLLTLVWRFTNSPVGLILTAVRDAENRATSLGYMSDHYKVFVFTLSAFLAGVAGSMKALSLGFATLPDIEWHMSGAVILMALVGGVRSWYGPALGAAAILLIENDVGAVGAWLSEKTGVIYFSQIGDSVTVVTGLIFIACVMVLREGLSGVVNTVVGAATLLATSAGRTTPTE